MQKYRSYVLPAAIILGLIFHREVAWANFLVPYVIFCSLTINFSPADIRHLHLKRLHLWLALIQTIGSTICYFFLRMLGVDEIICQGILIGIICPVAAAVGAISAMLGADINTVTSYTIIGNIFVPLMAAIIFSITGTQPDLTFMTSAWLILRHTIPPLVFPILLVYVFQRWVPNVNNYLVRHRTAGFYLWALAILLTIGKTIDFVYLHGEGHWNSIGWLTISSLILCAVQFGIGKWIGHQYGDTIAGGQLLGQKNTAMGIWMANSFLNPLCSVLLAFYSVFQNAFNSWQLWHHDKLISGTSSPETISQH
ncbi:MAG: hypothetical protein IJ764_04135 [Bacteroidales bacterium]|nr:hypothetical protein [Bacteroidales bacterium]